LTAAEQRAAEVRATRGPRVPKSEATSAPAFVREEWIDEGPLRDAAVSAAERAAAEVAPKRRRAQGELDPEVAAEVEREAGSQRSGRYRERLTTAAEALDRGRFDDARRMVQPVLRDLPNVAMAHEIAGLAFYSTGQWRKGAAELELARQLDHSVRHHPVLADCYRAMRRYDVVAELWEELKGASPEPAVMAEGRIVAAGALADQGDLRGALAIMAKGRDVPKKVREHHLRQWYVLGDLLDRSGEIVEARRFFGMVAHTDAEFADVMQRLASLGR
jgi:tetratricopeptide (TPR) repeat protein